MWWLVFLIVFAIAFSPGCCNCGPTCTVFSDDFSVDDLATNWTQDTSGSWSVSGGVLHCSSTSGRMICNTAHPAGTGAMNVKCDIQGASNDIARIIIEKDSSNYIYGEIKLGSSGYLKINQVTSGSTTTLTTTTVSLSTSSTFSLCITPSLDVISLTDTLGTATASINITLPSGSQYFGVGSGTTASSLTFDNIAVSRTDNNCGSCTINCSPCTGSGGAASAEYAVTFAGITNGTCSSCSSYNATFIVPPNAPHGAGNCAFLLKSINICDTTEIFFELFSSVFAGADQGAGHDQMFFTTSTYTTPMRDCTHWASISIPRGIMFPQGTCVGSSATCQVSSH